MFNTKIPLYSIMILIALIANIVVVLLYYNKNTFSKDEILGALVYENIGIICGAKILTYILNLKIYNKFNFLEVGFSSYGGIIGAILFLAFFKIQFKKDLKDFMIFMLPIPLMYAIGKIGCFLTGCCYGIKYSGIGNIIYKYSPIAPKNIQLFPIQIIETITFTLIFLYMLFNKIKNKFNYKTIGISFCLCGCAKFLLDYFRESHVNVIISTNQILSIIFVVIGLLIYILSVKKEIE